MCVLLERVFILQTPVSPFRAGLTAIHCSSLAQEGLNKCRTANLRSGGLRFWIAEGLTQAES